MPTPGAPRVADWSRRTFVRRLSEAVALASLDACTRMPAGRILPYTEQPADLQPGTARWYATSLVLDGLATGVLVETRDGRPLKVEGNPAHPASLGASGVLEQAAIWQLYDPDRPDGPHHREERVTPSAWDAALSAALDTDIIGSDGGGLAILMAPTSSPTDIALIERLERRFPGAGLHYHAPLVPAATWQAGHPLDGLVARPDFTMPRVILALDSDFLASGPFHLRHAHDYATSRAASDTRRLYVAEGPLTVTGGAADHRFAVDPAGLAGLLDALLALLDGRSAPGAPDWLPAVARDLGSTPGQSLVIAGEHHPVAVHARVAAVNRRLGNLGATMHYQRSPLHGAGDPSRDVARLIERLVAGTVRTLITIGGNPCFDLPGEWGFADLLGRVPHTFHAGLHRNETAIAAEWFQPLSHDFERWGDARAFDGTPSLVQPLIAPLHDSVPITAVLQRLAGAPVGDVHAHLQSGWRDRLGAAAFETAWAAMLRRGTATDERFAAVELPEFPRPPAPAATTTGFTARLLPDAGTHDGQFANVPWLQELPRPVTALTWSNAAHLAPDDAERLAVRDGTLVRLRRGAAVVVLPALIVPGQAPGCVALSLGFGRDGDERVAAGLGASLHPLQPVSRALVIPDIAIEPVTDAEPVALARTQESFDPEGRDPVQVVAMDGTLAPPPEAPPSLHAGAEPLPADGPQWAMTIDLDRCTGCSACVIACQVENNIPTVGVDEVRRGRAMHWIRLDTYHPRDPDRLPTLVQPMLCQQCEHAPCEYVCPVEATMHSPDGLNEMVYNRCVGTRFCSNNCPYKVRRFNWRNYTDSAPELVQLARNPDVTVRARGVMEKCTFCVQRIREAEIDASVAGRRLRGDAVRTACQQACPTGAIVFGSLTDPGSRAALDRDDPRGYDALADLGTRPRIRYLARRRNVNPELASGR